jgi:hypothetical protein
MRIDPLAQASFVDDTLLQTKMTLCHVKTRPEDFKWTTSELPPGSVRG